jgi:hypothetical protein
MPYKATALSVAGTWIGGSVRQSVSTGLSVLNETVAGSVFPLQANITGVNSKLTFSTLNVAKALTAVGALGLDISATPLELYEILYNDRGTIASGSVHRKLVFKSGRLVPRTLSINHQGNATLDLEMLAISTGTLISGTTFGETERPIDYTESIAAPSVTLADLDSERYTLGPATIGAVDIGCLQDLSIDFGLEIETTGCSSNPYPTQIETRSVNPMITATTRDTNKFAAAGIPLTGKAATQANTTIYLRKRKQSTAEFVAYATAEHIKINSAGLLMVEEAWSADGSANATAKIKLQCLFDGTNNPIVMNLASAIT